MTNLTFWLPGLCTGVAFTGGLAGWLRPRRGSNPPPPYCKPQPPSSPPQPLAADLICYSRWRDEQIRRAVTDDDRLDSAALQLGTGSRMPLHGWVVDAHGRIIGYIPRPQGRTPNPPPSDP